MFSPTDSDGTSDSSWWTVTMPAAKASAGCAKATSAAVDVKLAGVGWTAPARILMAVDLPEPLRPINAWTRPGANACEKSASANVPS